MEKNHTLLHAPVNVTLNTSAEPPKTLCHVAEPYTYVFAATLILLSAVGIIENIIVLTTMCKYRILRPPTMVLIGALAVIDLLTSAIVIPLYVALTLKPSVPWHDANIKLMTVVLALSLLTVVYMSVDRFTHVYYLQKYNMTRKKSIVGLLISWIAPFVIYSLVRGLFNWCLGREGGRVAGRVTAAVLIALCIVVIVAAYLGIFLLLRQHAKDVKDTLHSNYVENQSRASKTSLIIVGTVVVMNAPTLVYTIALSTGAETSTWFCTITLITLLGSSALNPFVYCLRMPIMRKHVLKLIGCRITESGEGEEVRMRMILQSNVTRSVSMERNTSVTVVNNKDSLKLLREKDEVLETATV